MASPRSPRSPRPSSDGDASLPPPPGAGDVDVVVQSPDSVPVQPGRSLSLSSDEFVVVHPPSVEDDLQELVAALGLRPVRPPANRPVRPPANRPVRLANCHGRSSRGRELRPSRKAKEVTQCSPSPPKTRRKQRKEVTVFVKGVKAPESGPAIRLETVNIFLIHTQVNVVVI